MIWWNKSDQGDALFFSQDDNVLDVEKSLSVSLTCIGSFALCGFLTNNLSVFEEGLIREPLGLGVITKLLVDEGIVEQVKSLRVLSTDELVLVVCSQFIWAILKFFDILLLLYLFIIQLILNETVSEIEQTSICVINDHFVEQSTGEQLSSVTLL